MPGFDGTGPMGRGPRSGRGMGRCRISPYCANCPFNAPVELGTDVTLEEKECFLEQMLAEIKAEKARRA